MPLGLRECRGLHHLPMTAPRTRSISFQPTGASLPFCAEPLPGFRELQRMVHENPQAWSSLPEVRPPRAWSSATSPAQCQSGIPPPRQLAPRTGFAADGLAGTRGESCEVPDTASAAVGAHRCVIGWVAPSRYQRQRAVAGGPPLHDVTFPNPPQIRSCRESHTRRSAGSCLLFRG